MYSRCLYEAYLLWKASCFHSHFASPSASVKQHVSKAILSCHTKLNKCTRPPKRVADSAEGTPQPDSLATIHSFADLPKPWKNPNYKKNTGRRTKTLKQVLAAEREKVFVKPEPKAPRPRGFQKKAVRESMAAERQAELESGQTTPAVRENVTTCAYTASSWSLVLIS